MNKEKFIKIYDFLSVFFCIFGGYIFYSDIENETVRNVTSWVCSGLGALMLLISFVIKCIRKDFNKKQLKITIIIGALGLISFYRQREFYTYLLMALNFINKDFKLLMKYIFASALFSYIFIFSMCMFGIVPENIMFREDIVRRRLGFSNPNVCFRFYLPIVISGSIIFDNSKRFLGTCSVVSVLLFLLTNSRAGVIIVNLFILLAMMPKKVKEKVYKPEAIPFVFVGLTALALILSTNCNELETLNSWLSNRLCLCESYLKDIGIIGSRESCVKPLDNLYIKMLYVGGVAGYLLYAFILFHGSFKRKGKVGYNLFLLCVITFIYGMVENCSSIGESFVLLPMFMAILEPNRLDEIEECAVKEVQLAK